MTKDLVKPSEKFLGVIREFPRPRDTTGVMSWFGHMNQCNFALSQSDMILLFRQLLKPSTDFARSCRKPLRSPIVDSSSQG